MNSNKVVVEAGAGGARGEKAKGGEWEEKELLEQVVEQIVEGYVGVEKEGKLV